jgi:hypothetical protein
MTEPNPNGIRLPSLDYLIERRDTILAEIARLELERDQVEALVGAVRAFHTGTGRTRTYAMIDEFFDDELPDGESATVEQVRAYAESHGWANISRNRVGAIRSALSRRVADGHLIRVGERYPARYAKVGRKSNGHVP